MKKSKNKYHLLRPNDNLNMQNDFIFFDTETEITEIKEIDFKTWELKDYDQKLKMGWAIYWNRQKEEKEYLFFNTNISFIDFVENKVMSIDAIKGKKELLIYAHNTYFDFNVCNGYEEFIIKRGWKIEKIYVESKIFILELIKNNCKIKFYDTFNYVDKSLEFIGKSIGLLKKEINLNNCTDEKLKEYCLNDVEIVFLFIRRLIEFLEENNLTRLKPTAASIAFNSFRHSFYDFKNKPIHIHNHTKAIDLERKSYKGGITDCFKIGKFKDFLIKLDVNSMYPEHMKKQEIPIKHVIYIPDNGVNHMEHMISQMDKYLVIANCDFYLPEKYAYILLRYERDKIQKTGFIYGNIRAVLTSPEIEFVMTYGKINYIREYSLYDKAIIFKDYVDFFYSKRMEYYKKDNKVFVLLSKLCLNSLYGKFAQRQSNIEIIKTEDEIKEISSIHVHTPEGDYTSMRIGKNIINLSKSEGNSYDSFVAISSFITAYARCYLTQLLIKAGRENIFYCDTDSIIMKLDTIKNIASHVDYFNEIEPYLKTMNIKKIKEIYEKKQPTLGKLKVEDFSVKSEFIRPKYYFFNEELKIKGVKKKHKIKFEDDKKLIVRQEQFQRFKTAIKKGNLGYQKITVLEKELDKTYDKGHIMEDKTIKPFSSNEVMLI